MCFTIAIGIGMGSIPILWLTVLRQPWTEVAILLFLLLFLSFKRLIDEPYMQKIKQESGW